MPGPNGLPGAMSAGGDAATALAARAVALVQVNAGRDGLDRRQLDVVVGEHVRLVGGGKRCAAGAFVGVDIARCVGILSERARDARPAPATFPLARRLGDIGLLSRRRRQRGIRRRLRRLAGTAFELRNACEQRVDPFEQRLVLRQQLEHQRLQAVLVERIERLGRHPELKSAPRAAFNAGTASQTDAEG